MASREAAEEAVLKISKKFGHLSDKLLETLEQFDPEVRQEVEQIALAKDQIAGHSIITLAQNIYGSDARFVFELLQNADDNSFTRAHANRALPAVSFHVYTDRIVVECNEDGFTERDLQAICSVGQSSKSASYGYIGAKGIGFKSVFVAAWKVYVQSGHFSFYFKHKRGDSGLGMVVPIWQDTEEVLQSPLTRITLYLHDSEGEANVGHLRETIFNQLSDLQETCLLFLRKLKKIDVNFYDGEECLKSSRSFRSANVDDHKVILETIKTQTLGNSVPHTKQFHVTRHMASDLSTSVSRQIPDTEEARRVAGVAEVVLAFPLTEDSVPLLEKQELFAFLPVRESDFKFIIQSDFDTSANRQDIITTSLRNIDLLDAITDAFMKAVLQFCVHPDLRFTWASFLPQPQHGSNVFWSGLRDRIHRRVCQTPLLMPRHGTQLRKVDAVVVLADDFKDDDGNPLLDDSVGNHFLSGRYPPESVTVLKEYGLNLMDSSLLASMLRADLEQTTSRMKSPSTSQRWHSIMAQLLTRFANDVSFRRLALLPLRSGNWISPDAGQVYLPTTEGIPVPLGVHMRILDPAAVANDDRRTLFERYGATEPSIAGVQASIRRIYDNPSARIDLAQSKSHLRFLYLSHLCQPRAVRDHYRTVRVHTSAGRFESPCSQDVFLPTDHPYGARELLGPTEGAPGFEVLSLNPDYLLDSPATPHSRHPSWEKWLCDFIGVRERLRLIARNGNTLSDIWTYVATHRSDKLLGLLEHLWKYEGAQISGNDVLKTQIQATSAERLCSSPLSGPCSLRETFLPLASLTRHSDRFMDQAETFPYLQLDSTLTSEQLRTKWVFLHEVFAVGIDDDLRFLLDILFWIKQAHPENPTIVRHQRLADLYIAIDAKCTASADRESNRQLVARFINGKECLYVPSSSEYPAAWISSLECVWEGPPGMLCRYSLKDILAQSFGVDQLNRVSHFFRYILQVPDACSEDIIEELKSLRDKDGEDFDRISLLYECLAAKTGADEETQRYVRNTFAEEDLIYAVKNCTGGWYKTSECLWSSTTDIRGKVTLNDHYEDLKAFFVETLIVRKLTLQMVYDELLQTTPDTSIGEVKSAIWSLNALLQTEPESVNPRPLLAKRIFPICFPNGTKDLVNADVDFNIGDRESLTAQFRDRIKLLDYDLAEVRQLRRFLAWTKLSNRCLSESVKETTSVSNENARTVSSTTRDLALKAHALLRVAATFNSPRYTADGPGLYESLRSMRTISTNEISSISRVFQDGTPIEVESRAGDVHIGETNGDISIYVPRDKRRQDFCYASPLPTNLAAWMMRAPVTQIQEEVDGAMKTALTILLSVPPSAVNLVLDYQGIIDVPITNEDAWSCDGNDESSDSTNEGDASDTAVVSLTPPAGDDTLSVDYGIVEVVSEQASAAYEGHGRHGPSHFVPYPAHPDPGYHQYRELLSNVVRAARSGQFPVKGPFDMSSLRSALSDGTSVEYNGFESRNGYRSNNLLERNFRVGAAGELYVFELMSNLAPGLRGWSQENWQSNIRDRVSVHEDYAGTRRWGGRETADLVYEDSHSDLTAMLIDHGYLDGETWRHARPYYYLEVKTTTGACGTPFYMSKNQYQRMTNSHNRAGQSEVYMILRVYEIESEGRIGMKVYVDPEQLRLDEELLFTGESWSVIPGRG